MADNMGFGESISAKEGWGRMNSDPKWRQDGSILVRRQGHRNPIQRGSDNKWESVSHKKPINQEEAQYLPVVLSPLTDLI
jgi:hypothetical protein